MKLHVHCPMCEAQYDMNLPDELKQLIPGIPDEDKDFVTLCKKCAVAILFRDGKWSLLPPEEFSKLMPEYQQDMLDLMRKLKAKIARDKEDTVPDEDEFFLRVKDNPAGLFGAPLIHRGAPQWDRMKFMAEAEGNKRISAVLAAIRQLNGIKPPDDTES